MKDDQNPAAGWYPDPAGSGRLRWWDGSTWTDHFESSADGDDLPPLPSPDSGRSGRSGRKILLFSALAVLLLLVGGAAAYFAYPEVAAPDLRVAITGQANGGPVATVKPDGSDRQTLPLPEESSLWALNVTGDGRHLVGIAGGEHEPQFVYLFPTAGGKARSVNANGLQVPARGSSILFSRYDSDLEETDVYTMDANGGKPEKVGADFLQAVSADGSRALTSGYDPYLEESTYALIDVASGKEKEIDLGSDDMVLGLSPDGKSLVGYSDVGGDDYYDPEAYLHHLDSGQSEAIGSAGTGGKFSEDGRRLLVGDDSGDNTVWSVITLDGSGVGGSETVGEGRDAHFVPGSNQIVLERDLGGDSYSDMRLFLTDPADGEETQIARGETAKISPDGKKIAYSRDEGIGDEYKMAIFTADLDGGDETRLGAGSAAVFYEVP